MSAEKATLYENAELYDDMLSEMKALAAATDTDLDHRERKLLSNAYKNIVGRNRASWRATVLFGETLEGSDPKRALVADYLARIVKELQDRCQELLKLLEERLIPKASSPESTVFYLKMKGDYLRYLIEVSSSEEEDLKQKSKEAYVEALGVSEKELGAAHPCRLGLALNFSVFLYEIENAPKEAYVMAKKSFDTAMPELDSLKEEEIRDAAMIMQLLRDNLTFWRDD